MDRLGLLHQTGADHRSQDAHFTWKCNTPNRFHPASLHQTRSPLAFSASKPPSIVALLDGMTSAQRRLVLPCSIIVVNIVRSLSLEPLDSEHLPRDRQVPRKIKLDGGISATPPHFVWRGRSATFCAVSRSRTMCLQGAWFARGCPGQRLTNIPATVPRAWCWTRGAAYYRPFEFHNMYGGTAECHRKNAAAIFLRRTSDVQTLHPSHCLHTTLRIPVRITGQKFDKLSNIGVSNPLGLH